MKRWLAKKNRAGFALITGLFIVMMIYLFTTVMVSDVHQNLSWTRFSSTRTQAQCAAEANATLAFGCIGSLPTSAPTPDVPSGSVASWACYINSDGSDLSTPPPGATGAPVRRLYTRANVGGQVVTQTRIIRATKAVRASDYVLRNFIETSPTQPATILYYQSGSWSASTGGSNHLNPVPALTWVGSTPTWKTQSSTSPLPAYVVRVPHICGDDQGRVYCIWNRYDEDGSPNEVLRYDPSTGVWALLPRPVGTGVPSLPVISQIACTENDLVVLGSTVPGGPSRVLHLNVQNGLTLAPSPPTNLNAAPLPTVQAAYTGNWDVLPATPVVQLQNGQYVGSGSTSYPVLSDIAVDDSKHIFVVQQTSSASLPSNVFRYDPQATTTPPTTAPNWLAPTDWQILCAPPQITFTWSIAEAQAIQSPSPLATPTPATVFATNLVSPCVDEASGDFFGCWDRNLNGTNNPALIDTIYHFTAYPVSSSGPPPLQVNGRWQANPLPPPHYDTSTGGSAVNGLVNAGEYVVDQGSNLLGCWLPSGGTAEVFTHTLVGGSDWKELQNVPTAAWQLDSQGLPQWHETLGAATTVSCLGGGGLPLSPGVPATVYVPAATY